MAPDIQKYIEKVLPYYRAIRHRIHANPELRYEETQTAQLVKEELEKMGLSVMTGIGKTGVVALLDTGKPGKTIALRADMDALPIEEQSSLLYRSKSIGKMHACGHDGHTASLLATASVLVQIKEYLTGKVKFIFQPAEEGGAGAKAMIEDGVLAAPSVDAIFAFHNHPGIPVGHVQTRAGCIMYGNTEFTIEVKGKSGHAAQPERAINPILVSAKLLENINGLSQALLTEEPTILSITRFNSGVASNIIPENALLSGTIRAPSLQQSQIVQNRLRDLIIKTAKEENANAKIDFQEVYPPTLNHANETAFVLHQAKQLFGEEKVSIKPASARASEDFSYFLQQVPGCYFLIGNGENSASCHNAHYDFDDSILQTAVELFCAIVMSYCIADSS